MKAGDRDGRQGAACNPRRQTSSNSKYRAPGVAHVPRGRGSTQYTGKLGGTPSATRR